MKRLVKLLISLGVRGYDLAKEVLLRLAGRPSPGCCVVLYYHGVRPELRQAFGRQMEVVVGLTTVLPADYRGELAPGHRYSVITFDDGFLSYRDIALPEMEHRQVASTVFVPTGSLGKPPQWIKRTGHPALRETVMTESQLRSIAHHPLVTIGSHSVHHPDFLTLDPETSRRELRESRECLESILGGGVKLFSFPHGRFANDHVLQAAEAGYDRIFGIQPVPVEGPAHSSTWGRVAVEPDDWPLEFHLKLLGAYRWMASRRPAIPI